MLHGRTADPAPLTAAQIRASLRAAYRELSWGLPQVAHELSGWRERANRIPDEILRADALDALRTKRTNTDGAAVFATLLDTRDREVIGLLAIYQALWDYLDSSVERHPTEANGRELHLALVDALKPGAPLSDYYRYHPRHDDGGYLVALVERCRHGCAKLPSYDAVRSTVLAEARRAQVQALNHLVDRKARDESLARWAQSELRPIEGVAWFEVTAAASASLVILPLLALAGRRRLGADEVARTRNAYWPWVTITTTMLDNFADQAEDLTTGNHNYFSHYDTEVLGVARVGDCIAQALRRVRALPDGERHVVIVASMIAMYLSKTNRGGLSNRDSRRRLAIAGGPLVRLLVPVLRTWRMTYQLLDS